MKERQKSLMNAMFRPDKYWFWIGCIGLGLITLALQHGNLHAEPPLSAKITILIIGVIGWLRVAYLVHRGRKAG